MFNLDQIFSYFKTLASTSLKFQISAAITFGTALVLVWLNEDNELKIFLTILFLFTFCMVTSLIIEKIYIAYRKKKRRSKDWNSVTQDELDFLSYYIKNKTKTRYVPCPNGTYQDSGIINPLIKKEILYVASTMSEFRGSEFNREQQFPINIHDTAYEFFSTQNITTKK